MGIGVENEPKKWAELGFGVIIDDGRRFQEYGLVDQRADKEVQLKRTGAGW